MTNQDQSTPEETLLVCRYEGHYYTAPEPIETLEEALDAIKTVTEFVAHDVSKDEAWSIAQHRAEDAERFLSDLERDAQAFRAEEGSDDPESSILAQRLLGAFKEVFNEVVSDWEDVYYGADPDEETEVWSRTDEAKERGFKRLEAIARGDEDPKTIEVAPEEATYEEVMWCAEVCEVYMPQIDRKRGRQLLQRFLDFEDLQTLDFEDAEEQDDAEMETAMSVLIDNSYESQRAGCPRDEIFAIALFEILKTERISVCIASTGDWFNRDLMTMKDQRGYGHHLFAQQFEASKETE